MDLGHPPPPSSLSGTGGRGTIFCFPPPPLFQVRGGCRHHFWGVCPPYISVRVFLTESHNHTADGQIPAPDGTWFIPAVTVFHSSISTRAGFGPPTVSRSPS